MTPETERPMASMTRYLASHPRACRATPAAHAKNISFQVSSVQGSINQFNNDVTRISELQGRSLNAVDGTGQNLALLDDQVAQTRDLGNQIKRRIEALKKQPVPRGQESRKNQVRRPCAPATP